MRTVAPSGASLLVLAAVTAPSLSLSLAAAGANVWPTTLPKWDPVWKVRVFFCFVSVVFNRNTDKFPFILGIFIEK